MKTGMTQHSLYSLKESFDGYCEFQFATRGDDWGQRIQEAVSILSNERGESAQLWEHRLSEAWGSADFPLILGDVIDRDILARYRALGDGLRTIFRQGSVRTFDTVYRNQVTGTRGLHEEVPTGGEYTQEERGEKEYSFAVKKYGKAFSVHWEELINDVRNVFASVPQDLAIGARYTEDRFITEMLFDSSGARDAYFAGTGGQSAVASTAFNATNLISAYNEMIVRTGDDDNELIVVTPVWLWVGPHQRLEAEKVLRSDLMITGANETTPNRNPASFLQLNVLVLNWLPHVVTTGTLGETSWGLFTNQAEVPAGEFAFLSGHEGPQVFVRESDARRIAGSGGVGAPEGSFSTERIDYKCRSVFGGTTMDARAGWASDGQ